MKTELSDLATKFLVAAASHQAAGQSVANEINGHMLGFGFTEKLVIKCNCLACQLYRTDEDFRAITDKVITSINEKRKSNNAKA